MTVTVKSLVNALVGEGPVFDFSASPIFGDASPSDLKGFRHGYDIDEESARRIYVSKVSRLRAEGYTVEECNEDKLDGRKGKQSPFEKWIGVYRDMPYVEKNLVLDHEYIESRLMRKTGKSDRELHPTIQKHQEQLYLDEGHEGLYHAAVEAGERTGMRRQRPAAMFG